MSKKQKISFVANTSWSIYNFRLEVAVALYQMGHQIFIIAPRDKHSEKLIAEGFTFIEAPIKSYSNNPLADLRYFFFLWKTYKHYGFDHIFHYTIKSNIYGSVASKLVGIQSTAVVTGLGRLINMPKGWKRSIVHFLYKIGIDSASHLWFLNNADSEYFKFHRLNSTKKAFLLPSEGVNLKKYTVSEEKDNAHISFLFAGRLLKEKGIELFIKAAESVKEFYPYVQFNIVGFIDPRDGDSIDPATLMKYQSRGIVSFHGDTEDIRPYISEASCVVLPSSYGEGVSRILLEAAAMSTPIITSHNRGCDDVVTDGYNGFLCKPKDITDLADQMMAFISLDAEAKRIMGANGLKKVEALFNIEKIISIYKKHLFSNRVGFKINQY